MTAQFARGPQPRVPSQPQNAPHAALLIDFDNVTMGIRSDLTKELKSLLNSDIIKGKVAVQRAYADWRRYPQYIVPLAENSVDLIFAPAYGSSKKNATDIRLAIDALELVFTRAEIGTFILLSGDSDFSSLVLKLKEYGKYVIGVGIRESSSDLLVQNCDEYYSYSGLTGLTRAGEDTPVQAYDPWELVEMAVRQMVENRDVMRSDRLKQILLELDPNFDEKSLGFTKFNRFVQEAATRGLLHLKKMENGQFEVGPAEPQLPPVIGEMVEPVRPAGRVRAPRAKPETRAATPAAQAPEAVEPPPAEEKPAVPVVPSSDGLRDAYDLLQRATSELSRGRGSGIRDSDVKRRMLELRPDFDEGAYGFSKFSRFLRQAHDAEIVNLQKIENGSYEVTPGSKAGTSRAPVRDEGSAAAADGASREERGRRGRGRDRRGRAPRAEEDGKPREEERKPRSESPAESTRPVQAAQPAEERPPAGAPPAAAASAPRQGVPQPALRPAAALGFRRGSRGGTSAAAPPPILAGQTVQPSLAGAASGKVEEKAESAAARPRKTGRKSLAADKPRHDGPLTFEELTLPTAEAEVIERLASYKGVGRKSAEATVQAFGAPDVFRILHEQPDRLRETLGARRAEQLLRGWESDFAELSGPGKAAPASPGRTRARPARRTASRAQPEAATARKQPAASDSPVKKKTRRGGRRTSRKPTGSASR